MANGLYFLEPVAEIIETVLMTACLRNEIQSSLILVGPSGVGKSKLLDRYQSPALHHTDSMSSQGLFSIAKTDPKNEKKFIMLPDINPTLSRKPSTVQATVSNLLSMTADGTVRIDDGRQEKECRHSPIGLITAVTDDMYAKQAKKWFALGLRRRIVPIFYKYSQETLHKLQGLVRQNKIHSTSPEPLKIHLNRLASPSIPKEMMALIEGSSLRFSTLLGKLQFSGENIKKWYVREVVPISPQITLQNLARAHALRSSRAVTIEEDYQFICRFLDFCDPEHPREI